MEDLIKATGNAGYVHFCESGFNSRYGVPQVRYTGPDENGQMVSVLIGIAAAFEVFRVAEGVRKAVEAERNRLHEEEMVRIRADMKKGRNDG